MSTPDPSSRRTRSPLFLIFITVFVDLVGFGIVLPVLPLFAKHLTGGNSILLGLLLASYSAMQFIFVPILGAWSDRIGRKPILLGSVLGTCASFLLMGYALSPGVMSLPLLFVARILDGISGANLSVAQAAIADVTTPENRSKGMGLIGAAFGLGFTLGPPIGGLLTHAFGPSAPGYAGAALAGLNALGILAMFPETRPRLSKDQASGASPVPGRSRAALPEALRRADVGPPILVFGLGQLAASITQVAFPLFVSDSRLPWKFDERSIGFLFAFIGLMVGAVQGGLIGRLVKRSGEVKIAWMGLAVLAASYLIFPSVSWRPGLYLSLAAMALGQGSMISAMNGLISRRSGADEQGRILGASQSMASLARVLGPLAAGWAYGFAPASAYYIAGAILLVALALASRFDSRAAR